MTSYLFKLSKNYFAVCDIDFNKEITSSTTLDNASKKARLLQTGYEMGFENAGMY